MPLLFKLLDSVCGAALYCQERRVGVTTVALLHTLTGPSSR